MRVPGFFFVPQSEELAREDIRHALGQPAMRRIFRRLLGVGNVCEPSFGTDGRSTDYNEGIRAVGLWLAATLEQAQPGTVATLMLESAREKEHL